MQLDDFLVKKYKLETLTYAHAMIREGFVLVNGRAVVDDNFPVSMNDEIGLTKEGIEKRPLEFFSFVDLSRTVNIQPTNTILAYGLLKDEYEILNQRKPEMLAICLENALDSVPEGIKKYAGNPFAIDLSREIKKKFDVLVIGLRLNTFQIAKLLDSNNPLILKNSKILVKIFGDDREAIDFRNALEQLLKPINIISKEIVKPKYVRNMHWLLLEKIK